MKHCPIIRNLEYGVAQFEWWELFCNPTFRLRMSDTWWFRLCLFVESILVAIGHNDCSLFV